MEERSRFCKLLIILLKDNSFIYLTMEPQNKQPKKAPKFKNLKEEEKKTLISNALKKYFSIY